MNKTNKTLFFVLFWALTFASTALAHATDPRFLDETEGASHIAARLFHNGNSYRNYVFVGETSKKVFSEKMGNWTLMQSERYQVIPATEYYKTSPAETPSPAATADEQNQTTSPAPTRSNNRAILDSVATLPLQSIIQIRETLELTQKLVLLAETIAVFSFLSFTGVFAIIFIIWKKPYAQEQTRSEVTREVTQQAGSGSHKPQAINPFPGFVRTSHSVSRPEFNRPPSVDQSFEWNSLQHFFISRMKKAVGTDPDTPILIKWDSYPHEPILGSHCGNSILVACPRALQDTVWTAMETFANQIGHELAYVNCGSADDSTGRHYVIYRLGCRHITNEHPIPPVKKGEVIPLLNTQTA